MMIRNLTILLIVFVGRGQGSIVPNAPPAQQSAATPVASIPQAAVPQAAPPVGPVTPALGVHDLHRAVLGMAPPPAVTVPTQKSIDVAAPQVSSGIAVAQHAATQLAMQPQPQPQPQGAPQPVGQPVQPAAEQIHAAIENGKSAAMASVPQPRPVATTANAASPVSMGSAATNAANAATNAANAAVAAANTAANAAASANMAANAAANANSRAASATSPAQAHEAATNAANAALAAASTAADAAASANIAATAAARADTAAKVANTISVTNAAATLPAHAHPVTAEVKTPASAAVIPATMAPPEASQSSSQWHAMQVTSLFAGLSFAMFVKALCVAGNVLVQVSPFPSVKRWEARGCTGEADAAPYVSIAFGGCQWCFYGLFAWLVTSRSGFLVLVHSNCLGAVLGTYYVTTFFRNCRHDEALRSLQKYLSAVTALALLQVCALSVLPAERALFLIGIISSFCSFINATSVLVTVPLVIRTKDSRSIPGPYAIANLLSSMVWSLCGFILADPCVMMPNMFSTCCAAASLTLKAMYPSREDDKLLSVEEGRKEAVISRAAKKALSLPDALTLTKDLPLPKEFTPLTKPMAYKTSAGTFGPESGSIAGKAIPAEAVDATDGTAGTCGGDGTGGTW